ncbi:hypothetical protein FQN49_001815, partial [Arthroderma sp. PD_2]
MTIGAKRERCVVGPRPDNRQVQLDRTQNARHGAPRHRTLAPREPRPQRKRILPYRAKENRRDAHLEKSSLSSGPAAVYITTTNGRELVRAFSVYAHKRLFTDQVEVRLNTINNTHSTGDAGSTNNNGDTMILNNDNKLIRIVNTQSGPAIADQQQDPSRIEFEIELRHQPSYILRIELVIDHPADYKYWAMDPLWSFSSQLSPGKSLILCQCLLAIGTELALNSRQFMEDLVFSNTPLSIAGKAQQVEYVSQDVIATWTQSFIQAFARTIPSYKISTVELESNGLAKQLHDDSFERITNAIKHSGGGVDENGNKRINMHYFGLLGYLAIDPKLVILQRRIEKTMSHDIRQWQETYGDYGQSDSRLRWKNPRDLGHNEDTSPAMTIKEYLQIVIEQIAGQV